MMATGRQVHAPRRGLGGTDVFVMTAMALTAGAIGMAAHQHFAVALSEAIVVGLSLFVVGVIFHALFRRRKPRPLPADDIERLTNEIARVKNASRGTRVPPPAPAAVAAAKADAVANQNSAGGVRAGAPNAARMQGIQDFWSVRPAATRAEPQGAGPSGLSAPLSADPAMRASAPLAPVPAEPSIIDEEAVRMLQAQIQRLAAKAEANEAAARQGLGQVRPGAAPAMAAAVQKAAAIQDRAIDKSIDALRATANAMRQGGEYGPHTAVRQQRPQPAAQAQRGATGEPQRAAVRSGPPPVSAGHSRIAAMAAAISAGRFDVLLESIIGLEDQHARHYEVSVQLHGLTDKAFDSREAASLSATGLYPLFDSARIAQAAEVALQLADKGKPGWVFASFSGESLSDPRFLAYCVQAGRLRGGYLAKQLVMTFAQSHVRLFSAKEWASIADLRTHGFRFALAAVNDLDMDFDVLRAKGFEFVKLDAQVFLEGMQAGSAVIAASDICHHLASLGLTTIVERVDTADKHERLFGHGVAYGQGPLFGGARSLRGASDAAA